MILLLGATGYIGQAFAHELKQRKKDFVSLSRKQVDYTSFAALLEFLKAKQPEFVVNAAGYTGKPNVDACELHKADTLQGNTLFPQTVAQACAAAPTTSGVWRSPEAANSSHTVSPLAASPARVQPSMSALYV